jgi:hypothetical protein
MAVRFSIVGLIAGCLLCACGGNPTVTCTNQAGVSRTWQKGPTSGSPCCTGGSGGNSVTSSVSKSAAAQSPPQDPRYPVLNAIADGIDPITAAKQFGLWTLHGPIITDAQRAAATDPRTYGWDCHG